MKTRKELESVLTRARGRAYEAWVKAQGYLPATLPVQKAHIADLAVRKAERKLVFFDAQANN